jgi:hypothetical protein
MLLLVVIMGILFTGQAFSWARSEIGQAGPEEQAVHAYNQHNLYYAPGPIQHFGK